MANFLQLATIFSQKVALENKSEADSVLSNFWRFEPEVAYKTLAYKKKKCTRNQTNYKLW